MLFDKKKKPWQFIRGFNNSFINTDYGQLGSLINKEKPVKKLLGQSM
jgi:hypothetical protein